jgi:hypothetical protein
MPRELINLLNAALPTLVQHPKLIDRSQVDVAIALIRWTENYILRWIDAKNIAESADAWQNKRNCNILYFSIKIKTFALKTNKS